MRIERSWRSTSTGSSDEADESGRVPAVPRQISQEPLSRRVRIHHRRVIGIPADAGIEVCLTARAPVEHPTVVTHLDTVDRTGAA